VDCRVHVDDGGDAGSRKVFHNEFLAKRPRAEIEGFFKALIREEE
jgi:hypothetical protein